VAVPVNDPTLVEVTYENAPLRFFGVMIVTVASLTIAWAVIMDEFIRFKTPFYITTSEYNIADLAKGIRTPNPDMALVGSSLSKRLNPGLFANSTVMDLSVGGGSVMTGLEVLSAAPALPKIVLVEINILDRPLDEEWKTLGTWAAQSDVVAVLSGVTKPIRYLLSKPLFSYVPPDEQKVWWNQKRVDDMSRDPATYDTQSAISAGRRGWDQRNNWGIAQANILRIKELSALFESRGVKVYLLYLPYADGYDNHPFARRNREIASGNDTFDCERCIDVRRLVNVKELRWGDGAHLDDRSAAIVAEALEKHFIEELKSP